MAFSGAIGKKVLALMLEGDIRKADEIVDEKGWRVIDDEAGLRKVIVEILAENKDKVCIIAFLHGVLHYFGRSVSKTRLRCSIRRTKFERGNLPYSSTW